MDKLISTFSENEFRDMREQMIVEGKEHQYQISDIEKNRNVLKYNVSIPDIEGSMEYTCNPKLGELSINLVGDKDMAKMLFEKNKVGLVWDNCNKTDVAEECETYQDMKPYSLKAHILVSIVNQDNIAIFTFHRIIMPK